MPPPVVQPSPPVILDKVDAVLAEVLGNYLPPRNEWSSREDSSPVPEGASSVLRMLPLSSLAYFPRLSGRLGNALEVEGFSEFEIVRYPSSGGETWELKIESDEMLTYRIELVQEIAGRVAVIIDDCGNSLRNKDLLLAIDYPITLAVLPRLAYSSTVDRLAAENGFEVMLHCPLEALNRDLNPGPGGIYCDMEADEMTRIFDQDIKDLPHAVGVNNHMGSAFTTHTEAMRSLLGEIKRNDLFFVDSLTVGGTVTASLASEIGIGCLQRDIFLDHEMNQEFIIRQFAALKKKAKRRGFAVAIGHDRPLTLEVLLRVIPTLAEDNLQLVPVSDLIFSSKK